MQRKMCFTVCYIASLIHSCDSDLMYGIDTET